MSFNENNNVIMREKGCMVTENFAKEKDITLQNSSKMTETKSYLDPDGSVTAKDVILIHQAVATKIEAVKDDKASNIDITETIDNVDNDNTDDLIRMGLPSDSLEPNEVDIRYAKQRGEIHPENIPSYARKCPDWQFLSGDSYRSMNKGQQPLEQCLPIQKRYPFAAELNLKLTDANRLCVIVFESVYDVQSVRTRRRIQELLLSFPSSSYTDYYSIGGKDIEILCRYSKEISIEHQEFGKIFEGIHAVKILSAGDCWKTRGYLYDTEFFGLIESPTVDEALQEFQRRCAEAAEEKHLYDEEIQRMAAELDTRSQKIREDEEARRLADKATISDTTTVTKKTAEAVAEISDLDIEYLISPGDPDKDNVEQAPSSATEYESPDTAESDIVTELTPVNVTETVTSEKSSDTVNSQSKTEESSKKESSKNSTQTSTPSTQTSKPSTQTSKPSTQTSTPSTQTSKPSTGYSAALIHMPNKAWSKYYVKNQNNVILLSDIVDDANSILQNYSSFNIDSLESVGYRDTEGILVLPTGYD